MSKGLGYFETVSSDVDVNERESEGQRQRERGGGRDTGREGDEERKRWWGKVYREREREKGIMTER